MKINKDSGYAAKFIHCLDINDIITQDCIDGKTLLRLKSMLLEFGYELKEIKEI